MFSFLLHSNHLTFLHTHTLLTDLHIHTCICLYPHTYPTPSPLLAPSKFFIVLLSLSCITGLSSPPIIMLQHPIIHALCLKLYVPMVETIHRGWVVILHSFFIYFIIGIVALHISRVAWKLTSLRRWNTPWSLPCISH